MSSLKFLKLFSFVLAAAFISFLFHSCKDDSIVNSGDQPQNSVVTISVASPKNSDTLKAGSSYEIKWVSNATSKFKIDYSTDGGAKWINIATGIAGNSYTWDPVPNIATYNAKIRVSTVDSSVVSYSSGSFNIQRTASKTLAIVKPNGGEVLNSGEAFLIQWQASNVTSIKIEFSSDNGIDWNSISSTYPADSGHYNWSPIPNITAEQCLLKITDVANDTVKDISKAFFKIASPKAIKVLSPNGGESWEGNGTKTITWYSSQIANVKLEYSIDNGYSWNLITANTPSNGIYTWSPVPNTPSANAKIRITNVVDNFPSDVSDSVFTISPEAALKIVAPNGGENWMSGSGQTIKWTSIGYNSVGKKNPQIFSNSKYFPQSIVSIKLEYSSDGGSNWKTIADNVPNNGEYYWDSVPSFNSSLCLVRISDSERGVPWDISDANFTIYNSIQQEVIVTKPNGSDILPAGSTQAITWTSSGIATVNIDFTSDNGNTWSRIVSDIPSNGYYSWPQVPSTASTNCKIKISDAADGFPSDQSNTVFTISPEPYVTVVYPNGGQIIQTNQSYDIQWVSENIANIKIEYTTNNGANWNLITASTPSDGVYQWNNVPSINSSLCRIRISDAADGQPFDISDNNFTISNLIVQTITLTSPDGGEKWESGTSHNITWTSTGVNDVKIEFSTNNGISWSTISSNAPNSGSFEWNVPNINSTQCKIRLSDAIDGNPKDESNAVFAVIPIQSLLLQYPNGGEVLKAGVAFDIKWQSTGIEKVKIEYTTNNGLNAEDWYVLVDSIPSTGTFFTSFSVPTNQYRIKISDAYDGSPVDQSDGIFTVSPQQQRTIAVVKPNGNENWLVGTTNEITWASTNIDSVKIEYTLNGGADWKTIADRVPSNGLYNWIVPVMAYRSDLCKIKISDAKNETPYDISDGFFSIQPQIKLLRWNFPNGGEYIYQDTVILWTSAGISKVNLEYTEDNGMSWNPIESNVPSTGAYMWHIGTGNPSSLTRIRVIDASDTSISDMSDSYFFLRIKGGLKIKSPSVKGGSLYKVGNSMNIIWEGADKISSVDIEYSSDNGKSWKIIAANIKNEHGRDNIYSWNNIPESAKGNILLRISDIKKKYSVVSKAVKIN